MKRHLLLAVLVGCSGVGAQPTYETVPADFKPGVVCIYYETPPSTSMPADGCGGEWVDLGTFVPAP